MNVRKTCQTCSFWSPTDQTLDKGMRVFGTCLKPQQYATIEKKVRLMVGWDDARYREQIKLDLKKAVFCLQTTEAGVVAYMRTGMDFGCNQHDSKDKSGPSEPSLTAKE